MIQRYFPCLPVSGFARRTLCLALVAALAACGGGGGGGSSSGNASASSGSGATTANTGGVSTSTPTNTPAVDVEETDVDAPVDFGSGPVSTSTILSETLRQLVASGDLMTVYKPASTSSTAFSAGAFGPAFGWPVMPIHMVLLPDGRVLSYGTDDKGVQGAQFH
jgi:ABC-type glycerol-3-phosphate transport system substrate-binding protein